MPLLKHHVNIGEGTVNVILQGDQVVVNTDDVHDQPNNDNG
jgi:hypothetical protein